MIQTWLCDSFEVIYGSGFASFSLLRILPVGCFYPVCTLLEPCMNRHQTTVVYTFSIILPKRQG